MTAVLSTVTVPLARAYADAKGEKFGKGKADTRAAVLLFLADHPATLRAIATNIGVTEGFGSRGRYAESVYNAVADSILGVQPEAPVEVTGA